MVTGFRPMSWRRRSSTRVVHRWGCRPTPGRWQNAAAWCAARIPGVSPGSVTGRIRMVTRRDLAVALLAVGATYACFSVAQQPGKQLDSMAWTWEALQVQKTAVGELRAVVRAPTRTLDELEMHITTLNPHTASHAPHTHPNEEMVIVRQGTLRAHVNGKEVVVGPGSVLFFASMQPHAVQNIGDVPATYFVINWASPGEKKKQIPKTPTGSSTQ